MNKLRINFNPLRLALVAGLLLISGLSHAAHKEEISDGQVNVIQDQQAKSIEQGIKLGKLTPKEARKLRHEQQLISQLEHSMRKDGVMTTDELRTLFVRLEVSRKHINKLSRNSISTSAITSERLDARGDQERLVRTENRNEHVIGR